MDDIEIGTGTKRVDRRGYEDYDADAVKKTRGADRQSMQLALVTYSGALWPVLRFFR
jgi:hypothetical protein